MPTSTTLFVSPTFNERQNLAQLVASFFAATGEADLLIVDDDSPDGTAELCRDLMSRQLGLHLLQRKGERGLGRAYVAGLEWGLSRGYEALGTMDADLSHDPRYLPAMIRALADAEVVIGSRYIRDGGTVNWRLRRILISWLANRFASQLLRVPAHDLTSGFRLYRRTALDHLALDTITSTGYSFLVELLFRLHGAGCRIAEVPIVFCDRTMGKSKMAPREIYVGAFRLLRLRLGRSPRAARAGPWIR